MDKGYFLESEKDMTLMNSRPRFARGYNINRPTKLQQGKERKKEMRSTSPISMCMCKIPTS